MHPNAPHFSKPIPCCGFLMTVENGNNVQHVSQRIPSWVKFGDIDSPNISFTSFPYSISHYFLTYSMVSYMEAIWHDHSTMLTSEYYYKQLKQKCSIPDRIMDLSRYQIPLSQLWRCDHFVNFPKQPRSFLSGTDWVCGNVKVCRIWTVTSFQAWFVFQSHCV